MESSADEGPLIKSGPSKRRSKRKARDAMDVDENLVSYFVSFYSQLSYLLLLGLHGG